MAKRLERVQLGLGVDCGKLIDGDLDGAQRAAIFGRQWSGQPGLDTRGHGRIDNAPATKRESDGAN
jgi:hypothetical protein